MNSAERQEAVRAEQAGMTQEEIAKAMHEQSEFVMDLNDLPRVKHNWVERGLKVSCEGAGHGHHSHFKRKLR